MQAPNPPKPPRELSEQAKNSQTIRTMQKTREAVRNAIQREHQQQIRK